MMAAFLWLLGLLVVRPEVTRGVAASSPSPCSKGPYLYDEGCNLVNQGIGSSMNRMKPSLLFATLMNATLIPNPDCFRSSEHETDLLDYFGWKEGLDCTSVDVTNAASASASTSASPLLPIEIEYGLSKEKQMQNDQMWKKHNGVLVHTCKMYGRGRLSHSTEAFWAHHSRNEESVFYPVHRAIDKARAATSVNGNAAVVFMLKTTFLFEGYECFQDWVYQRWLDHGGGREVAKEGGGGGNGKIVIAFHLRHGDVATKDVDFIDPWKEVRSIPLKDGVAVLQSLRERSILSKAWAQGQVALHFFSEGKKEEFQGLVNAFPETIFHLGTNATVAADLTGMASADVLLASPSSFTALAIALNHNGIALTTRDNPEKFAGLKSLVSQEEVRGGRLESFDKAFCRARLHQSAGRQVRNALCGIEEESPDTTTTTTITGGGGGGRVEGNTEPLYTSTAIVAGDYDTVYSEFAHLRSQAQSSMSVAELIALMPQDSTIRSLFTDNHSTATCQHNPDRTAFTMPEYQPTVCSGDKKTKKGRKSALSVAFAWVVRVIAQAVVNGGYQPHVYIVHGGNKRRHERISGHLQQAGIDLGSFVHWETGFVAGNLTDEERGVFVSTRAGSERCTEMMAGLDRACKQGYQFSPSERSVALKHLSILENVARSHTSYSDASSSTSSGAGRGIFNEFVLVLEDDQFLPTDIRRQVVEIVLQAPRELGFVMLDDSFFFMPSYNPPPEREHFVFAGSYERPAGRTMGAYLMSHKAASFLVEGSYMKPMYAPCDHQLGYAIRKGSILTHWAWPPVTCAGSQGLETYYTKSSTGGINMDSGDRLNCLTCCDRFVNVTTMRAIYDFV